MQMTFGSDADQMRIRVQIQFGHLLLKLEPKALKNTSTMSKAVVVCFDELDLPPSVGWRFG